MLAVLNQLGFLRAAPQAPLSGDNEACARPVYCASESLIGRRDCCSGRSFVPEFLPAKDIRGLSASTQRRARAVCKVMPP